MLAGDIALALFGVATKLSDRWGKLSDKGWNLIAALQKVASEAFAQEKRAARAALYLQRR